MTVSWVAWRRRLERVLGGLDHAAASGVSRGRGGAPCRANCAGEHRAAVVASAAAGEAERQPVGADRALRCDPPANATPRAAGLQPDQVLGLDAAGDAAEVDHQRRLGDDALVVELAGGR